jgi:hypothetical protein
MLSTEGRRGMAGHDARRDGMTGSLPARMFRSLLLGGLSLVAALTAYAIPPETADALRAGLDRRRAESPALEAVVRIVRGAGAGEETDENVLTLLWNPPDRGDGPPGGDAARDPAPADVPGGAGKGPRPDPAADLLCGLEVPLLRPGALTLREIRRVGTAVAPDCPRPDPRSFRPPGFERGHVVVGPGTWLPRRPALPDDYDLARPVLVLVLDQRQGPVEAILHPETLRVERLTWGRGGGRTVMLVESVRTAAGGGETAGEGELPRGVTVRGETTGGPSRGGPSRPGRGSGRRVPAAGDGPAVRGRIRCAEEMSDDPARVAWTVDGWMPGASEGEIVDVRLVVESEEIERGAWQRVVLRRRVPVREGRFQVALDAARADLVAGRARLEAGRPGVPAADLALPPAPPDLWRATLLGEVRLAARGLDALSGRATDPRRLGAFGGLAPWLHLPATRRALEDALQVRAAQGRNTAGEKDGDAVPLLRDLLAREARWAILERLASAPRPLLPAEARVLRRVLGELIPLDGGWDPEIRSLVDGASIAEVHARAPSGAEAAPEGTDAAPEPDPVVALKRRLRMAGGRPF